MGLRTRRVSVGDTPELLAQAPGSQVEIALRNAGDVAIDLGPPDVVAGAGFEMEAGGSFRAVLRGKVSCWAVAPAGQTAVVHVFEVDV